jgi:hypothetical protein
MDSVLFSGRRFRFSPSEVISMRQFLGVLVAAIFLCIESGPARAGQDDANAILDKAIKAMGGEEKLGKIVAFTWTTSGSMKVNGRKSDMEVVMIFNGLNQARRDFHVRRDFGGRERVRRTVLDGDEGWHLVGGKYQEMNGDAVANEKRNIYLQVIPTLPNLLKTNGFKYVAAGEEEVRGKPASILKVTGPDGKDFRLYFDKESFLPVREVARSVGANGDEQIDDVTFADYKDLSGIKKATSIEIRIDPQNFGFMEITDFKVLDRVDPATFAGPK